MGSKLSTTQLGKIWDLSDIDRDGFLTRYEFTVAMHLTYRALQGDKIPQQLPIELSEEKVPKPLSAIPNLASAAPKVRKICLFILLNEYSEGSNSKHSNTKHIQKPSVLKFGF